MKNICIPQKQRTHLNIRQPSGTISYNEILSTVIYAEVPHQPLNPYTQKNDGLLLVTVKACSINGSFLTILKATFRVEEDARNCSDACKFTNVLVLLMNQCIGQRH